MTSTSELRSLAQRLRARDPRALARLITQVENRVPGFEAVLDAVYPRAGGALRVGITGPPGAGKSTLVEQLARAYRAEGRTVGILACDPTSPFTGGALLGDRVRMSGIADDAGVFIRSVASRGSLGGLSEAADDVATLFEAFGFEVVLLETVGVGQAEIDVVRNADSVVVVLVPQSGDVVQAMKAGLMEIADVFCLNKSDQPGAELLEQSLQQLLSLTMREWVPPIVRTVAPQGKGIEQLRRAIAAHQAHLGPEGRARRRRTRLETLLRRETERALHRDLWDGASRELLAELTEEVLRGGRGPYAAVRDLLRRLDGPRPAS